MIQKKSTRQLLADSIVELMQKKKLDDITVADIVNNCGLSRRTFYNNFSDKFALIEWIYENEAVGYLQFIGEDCTWYSAILNKLNIILKNPGFYSKVYRQGYFLRSFYKITKDLHMDLLRKHCEVDEELEFLIDFYCIGCVSRTALWIEDGFKETPDELLSAYIECLPDRLKTLFKFDEKISHEERFALRALSN
jgi:AcrR family transcriptional regulator